MVILQPCALSLMHINIGSRYLKGFCQQIGTIKCSQTKGPSQMAVADMICLPPYHTVVTLCHRGTLDLKVASANPQYLQCRHPTPNP